MLFTELPRALGYNRIVNFLDANFRTRPEPSRLLALAALVGLTVGCAEDPAGTAGSDTRLAGAGPGAAAQFATPTPRVLLTPGPEDRPEMATPEPTPPPVATPAPTPTPTPATPSASPSAAASAGPFEKTGAATDIAVSGPGYFVLSTKAEPVSVDDLLFSKNGHLTVEKDTAQPLAVYRVRHGDHQFHLVGFARAGTSAVGAPGETSTLLGPSLLTSQWGGTVTGAGLALDADRNPEAASKLSFDYTGKLKVAEADPRGTDGAPIQAYVAIAQFDDPDALVPQPGFAGVYRYQGEAGVIRVGVAVTGTERPVGNANLILVRTLERGD